jgi:hypothetical protein
MMNNIHIIMNEEAAVPHAEIWSPSLEHLPAQPKDRAADI